MSAPGPTETVVTASPKLQFRLLGPLEATRAGVGLDLGTRKQRAVLALLLLNANRVVSTERMIDDLWGDAAPETARSALQVYVAGLRKALGDDGALLRTVAPGYVLDVEPGALDLERFSQLRAEAQASTEDGRRAKVLREALSLWRDTPLAELDSEPFASAASARLEEQRLATLEQRLDADLAVGEHAALVPELEALVAEHPYRERLRAQLMLALYRSGRQTDALRAYQAARRALRDELGLQPGLELRELEAAILRQDDRLSLDGRLGDEVALEAGGRRVITGRRGRTALLLAGGVVALVLLAAVLLGRDGATVTILPNSVAAIDPATNEVVTAIPVGPRPGPVTGGAGSLWVGSLEDRTLTRIDPVGGRIVRTLQLPATPTGLAAGFGALWVAHGRSGQLSRVDPAFSRRTATVDLVGRAVYAPTGSVAVGAGWVWAVFGKSTLVRVDPAAVRPSGSTLAGSGSADVVVGSGSVWVSNTGDSNVQRFDPTTFEEGPLRPLTVGRAPTGMAAGAGAVWVAIADDDVVTRIDPGGSSILTIPVGDGPEDVAVGADAVWVANRRSGTVSRIDPETNEVVETIAVGNAPTAITVANGRIWFTVQAP